MADVKSYLAASILTEDKVVTYRFLSRVLKVHVNAAKEMLFEFHRVQNAKKPGTIHATYLIGGTRRKAAPVAIEVQKDGEDDYMQSSPFVGSSMPQPEESAGDPPILSITLTREKDLDKIRSEYEHITSIHIYSLGPHPLKELQQLSDSTREIQTLNKSEDPLETYHNYGIITNPNAKRRTRKAPPIAAAAPAPVPTRPAAVKSKLNEVQDAPKSSSSSKSHPSSAKDFFGNKGKEKSKSKPQAESTKAESTTAPSSKESTPPPAPAPAKFKRQSSSIFKAFAKTQPKKAKTEDTDSSAKEDTPMKDVRDDDEEEEEEEEDTWMPAPVSKEKQEKDRRSRKEAQERLRKMMEEEQEGEEEEVEAAASPAPETPVEEPEEEKEDEKEEENQKEEEPVAEGSSGRRRGRRRVMKKRTMKDEDGYLVTKQEQAWESFSEDEPAPPPKAKTSTSTSATTKVKKDAPKKGQGNIMAFFGKK